jgi:hypothetical protein
MNSALEQYFDQFITVPDYDLNNPISQQQFFQEGGFARFFPVNPGGYQAMQPLQIRSMPDVSQNALWNSVANNGMQLGNLGLNKQQLNLQRDRFAYQKTQDVVDNKYKELQYQLGVQELDQRKKEFEINSVFNKIKLMNTMRDDFIGQEVLPQHAERWGKMVNDSGLPQALESGDIEAQAKAVSKMMGSQDYVEMYSAVKKRDHDFNVLAKVIAADKDAIQFVDMNKLMTEGVVDMDEAGYTTHKATQKALNDALTVQKTFAAQIAGQLDESELKEHALGVKVLESNMTGDPEQDMITWQKFNSKWAARKSPGGGGAALNPGTYGYILEMENRPGWDHEKAVQDALRIEQAKNSSVSKMQYSGLNPFGQDPKNPNPNMVMDDFTSKISKMALGAPYGTEHKLTGGLDGDWMRTFAGDASGFTFHGPNPTGPVFGGLLGQSEGQKGVKGSNEYTFIPHTFVVHEGGPTGTTTVKGTISTSNLAVAEKFEENPTKGANGQYEINNVKVTDINSTLGLNIPLESPYKNGTSIIGTDGKSYNAVPNGNGTYKIVDANGAVIKQSASQADIDRYKK